MREVGRGAVALGLAWALLACGGGGTSGGSGPPAGAADGAAGAPDGASEGADAGAGVSIAEQLGLTAYLGAATPVEEWAEGDETTYTFDPAEGPLCMRGAAYRVSVRDSATSADLVVFLQGGGMCWTGFCLAVTGAPLGVPRVDILDPENAANPVADWDVVYLPYCDGSFFAGDRDHDDDLNGRGPRYQRGLANLSAALEVARLRFPAPPRIFLAGSSGGAYGLFAAAPLVRHVYPDAELIVMADSGIGVARDGEPGYLGAILEELGTPEGIWELCDSCDDGHLTSLLGWLLDRDANLRVGTYASWYDSVLAGTFLQVPADRFADALAATTGAVQAAHPDRFRRFITDDTQHTTLLGDPTGIIGTDLGAVELPPGALEDLFSGSLVIGSLETTAIGDTTFAAWLAALIEGDLAGWPDVLAPRGPRPE